MTRELTLPKTSEAFNVPIVGIGASVGGLDALKQFFNYITPHSEMAFVLAAHHDFSQEDHLLGLISTYTRMETILIKNGIRIEPNKIYINPPRINAGIKNGVFLLSSPGKLSYCNLPINFLFRSLADDQGANTIAIILSGFAGFGISSLGFIKKKGGVVIAQDPLSTSYSGMPLSAINTGFVDYVLPPEKMPELLNNLLIYKKNNITSLNCNNQPNLSLNKNKHVLDGDLYRIINELNSNQISLEIKNKQLLKTQFELEESRNKYFDLYHLAPAGYFTLNNEGLIINVNNAGSALMNIEEKMLIGNKFCSYIADDDKEKFYQHCQQMNTVSMPRTCEIKLFKKDNSLFYTRILCRRIINKLLNSSEILLFIRNITVEKEYEDRIHQLQAKIHYADRLSMIEQLGSMIVQELNQPLGVIANYANGCIRRLKENKLEIKDLLYAMHQIVNETFRADEVYQRLKKFKCKNNMSYILIDMDDVIKEVMTLIQYEIPENKIALRYRPALHLPKILLDRIHIEQVLLNLARNAIEAMMGNDINEPELIIETEEIDKSMIVINVIDNGPGFTPDIANKLFEPNFNTKTHGTGLGLAISRTVIEAHGGQLTATMVPKGGTCFKVTLPVRKTI